MQKVENIDETPAFAKHVLPAVPSSEVYLEDCVKALKRFNDNHFDLAIVDPPYGIGAENHAGNVDNGWKQWTKKSWDSSIPDAEYFEQLFRVSKNQIIWGGNYFASLLPNSQGWIFWDKGQNDLTMSDGEMAWTSFSKVTRQVTINRAELIKQNTFHPTEKPVKLYKWLLSNYATEGDRILDTHLGSGSIAVACDILNFELVGCEIDEQYYLKAQKRYENERCQTKLF